jgi:hypothetical protein
VHLLGDFNVGGGVGGNVPYWELEGLGWGAAEVSGVLECSGEVLGCVH